VRFHEQSQTTEVSYAMPDPRLPPQLHCITADCIRYHKPRCLINTDDDDANNYNCYPGVCANGNVGSRAPDRNSNLRRLDRNFYAKPVVLLGKYVRM